MTTTNWLDGPPLTLDVLRGAMDKIAALGPVKPPVEFIVRTAAEQRRTACDVPLMWMRPAPPSKANGRRGTRRAWKRAHPPHWLYTYREPTDVLVMQAQHLVLNTRRPGADVVICTPAQYDAIVSATKAHKIEPNFNPWSMYR